MSNFHKMGTKKDGNPHHLPRTEESELISVFCGLRVHAVLPARSASPCARFRAAPVEKTAAAVSVKPRREQSGEEPKTTGSGENSATYARNFATASGDLVKSGINCLGRVLTRTGRYLASGR